jgi:hypothetical protein
MPGKGDSVLNLTSQVKPPKLRPYECWLHLTHTIENLGIIISACTECSMLHTKILSITPVSYPSPSCKDHPDFSYCLSLHLINCPLNKDISASVPSVQSSPLFLFLVSFFPFHFNKTLLLFCNLYHSLFERCKYLRSSWPGIFWRHPTRNNPIQNNRNHPDSSKLKFNIVITIKRNTILY